MVPFPQPKRYAAICGLSEELLPHWPARCVDLVFFSPPYEAQRTYETGMPGRKKFKLSQQGWVDWLAPIIVQCARLSKGLVCVNMSSPVVDRRYTAAVEWLVADLTRIHGLVCGPSPYAWVKGAGIPGSGQSDYQRRDWEPVYTFALPDRLPLIWSDNTAFGRPPKYAPGGECSHRRVDGKRANQWGGTASMGSTRRASGSTSKAGRPSHRKLRQPSGSTEDQGYTAPAIANPGNVLKIDVGGHHQGSKSAHKGEAPMPVAVAERFLCWFCPPDGLVLDPFCGTGTTIHAAINHRRRAIGIDLRPSQIEITRRRCDCIHPPCLPVSGESDSLVRADEADTADMETIK